MTTATRVSTITYAQRAPDGHYWVADGVDAEPRRETADTDALATSLADPEREVRMLGDRANASLVVALYSAGGRVALASPRFGRMACPIDDAIDRIACVRRVPEVAASLGGFHSVGSLEVASYAVAADADNGLPYVASLSRHPMLSVWSFAAPLDVRKLVMIVAAIRDPRWFVDPDHPSRSATLRSYFGLCGTGTRASRERYEIARSCWSVPGGLFAREHAIYLGKGYPEPKSAIRTTRRFLEFLSGTWLNALTLARRPGIEQAAWDSRVFFDDATASSYATHVRGLTP